MRKTDALACGGRRAYDSDSIISRRNTMKAWSAVLAMGLLGGSALGVRTDGGSTNVTYTVPHTYQVVYMRAAHQANECKYGTSAVKVRCSITPAMSTGVVSVVDPITGIEMARTSLK